MVDEIIKGHFHAVDRNKASNMHSCNCDTDRSHLEFSWPYWGWGQGDDFHQFPYPARNLCSLPKSFQGIPHPPGAAF